MALLSLAIRQDHAGDVAQGGELCFRQSRARMFIEQAEGADTLASGRNQFHVNEKAEATVFRRRGHGAERVLSRQIRNNHQVGAGSQHALHVLGLDRLLVRQAMRGPPHPRFRPPAGHADDR